MAFFLVELNNIEHNLSWQQEVELKTEKRTKGQIWFLQNPNKINNWFLQVRQTEEKQIKTLNLEDKFFKYQSKGCSAASQTKIQKYINECSHLTGRPPLFVVNTTCGLVRWVISNLGKSRIQNRQKPQDIFFETTGGSNCDTWHGWPRYLVRHDNHIETCTTISGKSIIK